ncbi:MAG TPA: DMT family transporter [Thermoplasmata archaeon]|nr:DMT family transporter [Thermoplasmata archaeon]
MALEWLAWVLGATVIWGFGTLAAKPSTDRLGPRTMGIGTVLIEGGAFAVLGLFLARTPLPGDAWFAAAAVAAGALGAVGYLFFYEGMRVGTVGIVGTISAACPMLTVILSVVFLSETLGILQAVGIGLIMFCVLVLAYEPKHPSTSRRAAVLLSLAGFFVWGIWGFLVKASVSALGEGNLDLFLATGYLGVTAGYAFLRRAPRTRADPPSARGWGLGLFVFLAGGLSAVALTIAYDLGPAALVAPISGTYPIIATLAAAALLREKVDWRIAAALIAFGVGILLLSGA